MKKEKKKKFYFSKYFIAFIVFVIWMLFFDNNSVVNQVKLKSKLTELQNDTTFYQQQTKKYREMTRFLNNDMENLERIGREEYRMKRDDEVVYIIQK